MRLPFDTVKLRLEEGVRWLSASEFRELPLDERLAALLQKRVDFYRDHEKVDLQTALRAIRQGV